MSFGDENLTDLERIANLEKQYRFMILRVLALETLVEEQALAIEELQNP